MFLIKADEALGRMHAFIIERESGIIFTITYTVCPLVTNH